VLSGGRGAIQIIRIRLAFAYESHQSDGKKKSNDLARRFQKWSTREKVDLPFYRVRQRFVLFSVGAQKPEHDGLVRTLVRLLIEQIAPVGERIVGRRCAAVGGCPTLGRRSCGFGHGETLGGEFGVGAVHEVFALRLYLVFGVDGMDVIVHPGTIENEETVRGIRGSVKNIGRAWGGRGVVKPGLRTAQTEKMRPRNHPFATSLRGVGIDKRD
jgi:hypothetical protein